jgi:uncharacterized membrane protein|nr:MAG TPA: QueT transporter [Caudoviricetes sp.]
MNKSATLWLVRTALIAALYVTLTVSFSAISYGPIQFRVSEFLILLPLWNHRWTPGIVVGTIIANFFSPLGLIDVIFGSLATFIGVVSMVKVAKMSSPLYSLICPVVANAYLIALELRIVYSLPFWESSVYVGISEAIIVLIGYFLISTMAKNSHFRTMIGARNGI